MAAHGFGVLSDEIETGALAGEQRAGDPAPGISAVVCTRNRGGEAVSAIRTILANRHPNFELILVDQSTNDDTETAIRQFCPGRGFRYLRTATVGAGIARNLGLRLARADIVAFTDDDCTVAVDWLAEIDKVFQTWTRVAVVFSSVEPGPHDGRAGLIPSYRYAEDKLVRSLEGYYRGIGMGAGMAVRKSAVLSWGGFDESLGPGSPFRSAEDHDIAVRALANGLWVYELSPAFVTHHGFRSYQEFAGLTRRDWYAIGAVHAKLVKRFDPRILPLMLYNTCIRGFWQPFAQIFLGRRPQGFKRLVYYCQGFVIGLRTPVNDLKLVYRLDECMPD